MGRWNHPKWKYLAVGVVAGLVMGAGDNLAVAFHRHVADVDVKVAQQFGDIKLRGNFAGVAVDFNVHCGGGE